MAGHEAGSRSIRRCTEACIEAGIEYLTLYAFSSENWRRPEAEVSGLMALLERFLDQKRDEMVREGIRLLHIGRREELPAKCRAKLDEAIRATSANRRLTLVLALSYSGRAEIVDCVRGMVRDAAAGRLGEDEVSAEAISARLDTAGIPDPDLLIRTSGEMRVSNFLLWQIAYTEIHVTETLWPDFRKEDFQAALDDYRSRSRRYGGL